MANSYAAPNFNIDTSGNLSDIETAVGHVCVATDVINIYNNATLTVDVSRSCLIIKLGETSTGDPGAGLRRGNVTFNAGITTTFDGNATATNSGIKSSPAATNTETKSNTLSILGTAASPTVFTNAAGAYSATNRWMINMTWGVFGSMGTYTVNYPSPADSAGIIIVPVRSTNTVSTEHNVGSPTIVSGANAVNFFVFTGGDTIPLVIEDITINLSAQVTNYKYCFIYRNSTTSSYTMTHNVTIKRYYVVGASAVYYFSPIYAQYPTGQTTYGSCLRLSTTDIRPTTVVPTGLTLANMQDGTVKVTVTNFAAGTHLVLYDGAGNVRFAIPYADYVAVVDRKPANCGLVAGVPLSEISTWTAKFTSDFFVYGAATAAAAAVTPAFLPAVTKVITGNQYGQNGTEFTGTFSGAALETPKILGQVRPADTNETTLYTVPASTTAVVSTVTICNQDSSARTFRIAVTSGGATAGESWLFYDVSVPANETFTATLGITLPAAAKIIVKASVADKISFNAFGLELS